MYPGQLPLLAPGGFVDPGVQSVLQPLKASASSDLCSAYTSEAALSVPSLCAPTPGTNSTNAVGGSGVSSQGGSQSLGPNSAVSHQRKGTFDDLHKLLDNWTKDAMSLSQSKKSAKQLHQTLPPGHSYELIQSANLGRKYSAPGQLCPNSMGGSVPLPTTPSSVATSLSARKGSLPHHHHPASPTPPPLAQPQPQPPPPQFLHYTPSSAYSAQWSNPTHLLPHPPLPVSQPLLISASQPLGPYPPTQSQLPGQASLQAFHLNSSLHKSVSNPGGPNLRTT